MANRTAWTAGNGVGLSYSTIFSGGGDTTAAQTLATGNTLLSSLNIANGTALDILCDISIRCTIASSTVASGANIAIWIYDLLDDGVTYGDGLLTAGTAAAHVPAFPAAATLQLFAAATQTALNGCLKGITLPPGSFSFAVNNGSGFAFTAANILYRTYNLNLNN
jgi:hypothetical protein